MKKILFLLAVVLAFASCEPKFEKEYSWAYPVAGDWIVNAYDLSDSSFYYGPFEMRGYNSSFGKDSIWFDDYASESAYGQFWSMKYKVAVNMASKTFSTTAFTNGLSYYNDITVDVANGKIVGNDSIYMEVTFSDDPTTFIISGHRELSYDEYMGNF